MTTKPTQFTPGTWSINEVRNEPEKLSIVDADMCFVADIWQTYMDGKSRQQDNATLIAAAPAMYEALQAMIIEWHRHGCCDSRDVVYKAERALSQAEGR